MPLPPRILPAGFIAPCLPSSAPQAPSGEEWPHEIKHDGFRVIARKDGASVRLYSRPGNDLTKRFPLIVEGLAQLRLRSCIIDGEAVAFGALSGLDQVEEPAPAVKREAEEDWGGRSAKPFPPVTMGHIRAHGCRDLLVYCGSGRWHQARGLARIASPMICRCVTLPADGLHPMRYDSR